MSNLDIVQKACWAFDHGQADAGELNELFDYLAKEAFPNDHDWRSKALSTRWGSDLLMKSASGHLRNMQMLGGHNEDAIRKLAPRAVDVDRSVSDGTGGQRRSDNTPDKTRTQHTQHLNPAGSEPPNGAWEPSYDHLAKFKMDLLRYLKSNPDCSYESAIDAVGSQHHVAERMARS